MDLSRRGCFLKSVLFLMVLLASVPVRGETAEDYFSAGQSLFQQGKYNRALQSFEQARSAGMQGSSIVYNLAVTHYKLRHYKTARQLFLGLRDNPSMRPLAELNLGLVEDKLKNEPQAKKWFIQAYEQKADKKVRMLAWQALDQMGVRLKKPFQPETAIDVSLSVGLDSNVVDPVNPASNITDSYLELYTYIDHGLSETMSMSAMLLSQDYSTANSYDFQIVSLNLDKSFSMGAWNSTARGMFNSSTLGGTEYQSVLGAQLQAEKNVSKTDKLRLRYRYQQISSVANPHLVGWRMKLRSESINRLSGNRWRYELELNDRADSLTSSFSPTRHIVRYYYRKQLSESWKLNSYLGLRLSDYNRVAGISRSDTRMRAKLRFKKSLGKSSNLLAEYSYTNNRSNVAGYSYDRNLFSLGLQTLF
ncbi:MAG: hypothetical protein OEX03_05740 [Gammaproteobacteria bacterium]|nr:hypothetical protein [Gammaproteobacteria bacterium]